MFVYEPETGILRSKIKRGKLRKGDIAGSIVGTGHVLCGLGERNYQLAHRIIWTMIHGLIPDGLVIDHINHNASDNRIGNLRLVHRIDNQRNMKKNIKNTSGVVGVGWYKNYQKWTATIQVRGKAVKLGYFASFDDAVEARRKANIKYGFHPNHGRHVTV